MPIPAVLFIVIICFNHLHAESTLKNRSGGNSTGKCICGRASQSQDGMRLDSRVVGGEPMERFSHRFLAGVANDHFIICGGSVVSPHYVLTAAHCTKDKEPSELQVYLGLHERKYLRLADKYPVRQIIMHSGYQVVDDAFVTHDLALLRVDRIQFKNTVQPICIPSDDLMDHAKYATVAGWGNTKSSGSPSAIPLEAKINILSVEDCLLTDWGPAMDDIEDSDLMTICAYRPATDACMGDSGGPFYVRNAFGTKYQIGIVSFGDGCANTKGTPGIYTRLSYHSQWLQEHIDDLCVPP